MQTNKKSSAADQGKAAEQTKHFNKNIAYEFNKRKPLRRFTTWKGRPI